MAPGCSQVAGWGGAGVGGAVQEEGARASLWHGQWPIRVSQYTQRQEQFQFKASWAR